MNLAQKKVLYYSLCQKVSISQLKEIEYCELDSLEEEKLLKWMDCNHIQAFSQEMSDYPHRLLQIPSAPYLFYAIGNLDLLSKNILGIVGPRMMSGYAEQVMESLFEFATHYDIVTISGLARGVDQKCHTLSLKHSLPTVAVLWGGLRRYLQRSDARLIQEIVGAWGLVISEFKLDFEPTKWSFPQRNRIIAWLSDCLFLPEARKWSGSLITVEFALKMKKKVFVAPNQLFSQNGLGTNQLVSQWKVSLLSDFSQLFWQFIKKNQEKTQINNNLTSSDKALLNLIASCQDQELSTWISQVERDFWEILSQLTLLEMKWVIVQKRPGFYFVK